MSAFILPSSQNRFYRELLDEYLLATDTLPGLTEHRCFSFKASCLSCEQAATWGEELQCLYRSLDMLAPYAEGEHNAEGHVGSAWSPASSPATWGPEHAREVIRGRITKIYERHGHELAAADKARAAREAELSPVSTKCSPAITCSHRGGSRVCVAESFGGSFEEEQTALQCRRLLMDHVQPELVSDELGRCLEALASVARRLPFGEARNLPLQVAADLYRKQSPLLTLGDSGRGALERQLVLLGALQETLALAYPRRDDAEHAAAIRSTAQAMEEHLGALWQRLRARAGLLPSAPDAHLTGESLLSFLSANKVNGRMLDQRLLRALFMPPEILRTLRAKEGIQDLGPANGRSLASYPVLGAATPRMAADALRSLVQHLDARLPFHDVSCAIANHCAAPTTTGRRTTPDTELWRLLVFPGGGARVPPALLGRMSGWGELLSEITPRVTTTAAHFSEESGQGPMTATALDAMLAPFADLQRTARAHAGSYDAFGVLDPTSSNALDFSVDPLDRDRLIHDAGQAVARLRTSVDTFEAGAQAYLSRASEWLASSSSLEALNVELQNKWLRLEALADRVAALRKRSTSEAEIIRSSDANFYAEAMDTGALVQQGDTLNFSFTGASPYQGGRPILEDLALGSVTAAAGSVLMIETSGVWSPTCALTQVGSLPVRRGASLDRHNVADFHKSAPITELSPATTGPEGFTVVQTESGYRAVSHQAAESQGFQASAGTSLSFSISGVNIGGPSGGYQASDMETDSTEENISSRTDASFSSGLFLQNTPYRAPVGSLLLVRPELGSALPMQVQVVRSGLMRVQVPLTATYAFVVNDLGCARSDETHHLDVRVSTFIPQEVVIREAVTGLSLAIDTLKSRFPTFVQQGGLLPSDGPAVRAQMWREIQDHLTAQRLSPSVAPALESYLSAAIERSINVLEVRIESMVAEREIHILRNELSALDAQLAQVDATRRLLELAVRWTLENLDEQDLQVDSHRFLRRTSEDLLPLIAMWYPEALTNIAGSPHVEHVLQASLDDRLVSIIENTTDLVTELFSNVETTAIRDFRPQKSLISIRIPLSEEARLETSLLPTVDALRSQPFSEAVRNRGSVLLPIYPDDVYSAFGGLGRLFCNETLPVVEHVALHFVVPGVSGRDLLTWNTNDRRLLHSEAMQTFVLGAEGSVQFELQNERQRDFGAPISYSGTAAEAGGMVAERLRLQDGSIVGLSPFSTLVFDFQDLAQDPQAAAHNTRFDRASELIVFLEIDSKWVSPAEMPQWIRACARGPGGRP